MRCRGRAVRSSGAGLHSNLSRPLHAVQDDRLSGLCVTRGPRTTRAGPREGERRDADRQRPDHRKDDRKPNA